MQRQKTYGINEIFYSLQGEGAHTGTPMVFVRFAGCNCRCSFCDTDFAASTPMTAAQIVARCRSYGCQTVVLTGGEPLLQADDALVDALHDAGLRIHVETNGTLPLPRKRPDWVTCSPKTACPAIDPAHVDEVKIVYHGQPESELEDMRRRFSAAAAFLQPCAEADPAQTASNTAATVQYILDHPQWRLSLQTHKLIDIP